jgi:hypothetical protein
VEYAGYNYYATGENISAGQDNIQESIDGLFAAIYHRFGFLNFHFSDVGTGIRYSTSYTFGSVFSFNMGVQTYSRYQENSTQNPAIVVWPYENQENASPVFYEESPDPLPNCSVSANPISIQFNPSKTGHIIMHSFKLYDEDNIETIDKVILTPSTDPNSHFSTGQYALFPLQRLDWGSQYHAEFNYTEDDILKSKLWSFKTKSLKYSNYIFTKDDATFNVLSGKTYIIYIVPAHCNDTINGLRFSYNQQISLESNFIDPNTIQVSLTGPNNTSATFYLSNGKQFTFTLSAEETPTNIDHELANKSFDIGWYFWKTPSNNFYLAQGRDNDIHIWQFITTTKEWIPVHNASFNNKKVDSIFTSVSISQDAKHINIGVDRTGKTHELQNQSYKIGWYFWKTPSNNFYLAQGRDDNIHVWQFITKTKEWIPVHNASFGKKNVGNIFNGVSIDESGLSIRFW